MDIELLAPWGEFTQIEGWRCVYVSEFLDDCCELSVFGETVRDLMLAGF